MNQKKEFFERLKEIFIAVKINSENYNSGLVNLMKIKSEYFDYVLKELKKVVDEKTKEFPNFQEEMFSILNTFFNNYFSKSGSIFFNNTLNKNKIYEKIYTENKDVVLFWKTRTNYYIKTDRIIGDLSFDYTKNDKKY